MIDLLPFATPRQAEIIRAVLEHGTHRAAARALGIAHSTVTRRIETVRKRAQLQGHAPEHDMTHTAPSMFKVKGVSSYYGKDGDLRGQWVKTFLDADMKEQAIRDFVADLTTEAKGKSPLVEGPKFVNDDLLAVYPIGDPHFGLLGWTEETGQENFDLERAETLTTSAVDYLVQAMPPTSTAILLSLGDLFHADNRLARTERSGNPLDVSARWPQVMRAARRAFIHAIFRCLEKHQTVIVRLVHGNHDPHSSMALALALESFFHNNPRVKVDISPSMFWYYRFGRVLIGATHGDTTKMSELGGIMAYDRKEDWALTDFRYWYQGHIHHKDKQISKESPGVIVEAFRTLAASDAWHAGEGYRSGRDMHGIVHHREFGEFLRARFDVSMLPPR